jgi:hypothetical protein
LREYEVVHAGQERIGPPVLAYADIQFVLSGDRTPRMNAAMDLIGLGRIGEVSWSLVRLRR